MAIPQPGTSAYKAYLRATGSSTSEASAAYAAQQSIPPVGTSAHKAYTYSAANGSLPSSLLKILSDNTSNGPVTVSLKKNSAPTAQDYSSSSVTPAVIDYLNADLAKHYGMSKSTAYQEALENTSYQRAVSDLKAAGLNPSVLFGAGRVSGSGSSVYPSEDSPGGYSYRSSGSGKSNNGKLFSTSAYGALSALGGLAGILVTGRPDGFWIGSQTTQGAMNLLNALSKK